VLHMQFAPGWAMGWADVGDGSFSRAPGSGAEDLSAKSKERTTEPHEEGSKKKKKILGGSNTRPLDYLRDTWITILPFCHLKKLKNLSIRSPSLGFRVRVTNPRPVSFDHGSRSLDDQWPRVGTKWQLLLLDRRASWRWPPTIRSSSAEKRSPTMCGHDNTLRQVRTSSEGAWQKP